MHRHVVRLYPREHRDADPSPSRLWRGSRSRCRCAWRRLDLLRLAAGLRFRRQHPRSNRLSSILFGAEGLSREEAARGCWCHTAADTGTRARCPGVSGRGSRRIEYPPTLVRGCSRDEHSPMSRVFLTHSGAQAVHALRSGRPSAQGGWVKGSCLVRDSVPTDRRHAALKQRMIHRLRGTEDER